jgi:hypothetical protein
MANKQGARKLPSGAVPSPGELQREAANAAGEARREKEKKDRRANAESQKRYRESMKARGYRALLIWDKPPEKGKVKAWPPGAVPVISEKTAGICERNEDYRKAVNVALTAFFTSMRGDKDTMNREGWTVYHDIETLLSPLGYKNKA